MAKKRRGDESYDVSGISVDDRGKVRNKDIPDESRRGAVKKGKRKTPKPIEEIEEQPKKKRRKKEDKEVLPKDKLKKRAKEKKAHSGDKPASEKQLAKMERRKERALRDLQVIEAAPDTGDEYDETYRDMFDNLRHIVELFETKMMDNPSSRDVYALSTLYSQLREVINDIRSTKDVAAQVVELEAKAYGAFKTLVGQAFVDLYFLMQKDIRAAVKNKDEQEQLLASLKGGLKDQGVKVEAGYAAMLQRVHQVLV